MKKTLLAASLAAAMGVATTAEAAFTPMGPGDYKIDITGGCFAFGTCAYVGDGSGAGEFTDNNAAEVTTSVTAAIAPSNTRAIGATIGSGTVDGTNGTIEFSIDTNGDMTITSYAQDSYLATAGGTFYVDALGASGTSLMSGNINGTGDISFSPTGREGLAIGFYTSIGTAPWNIIPDDAVTTETTYASFTTGTQSDVKGKGSVTMTGSVLQDTGTVGEWTGVIVSANKVNGQYWFGFDNTLYTEQFNLTVTLVKGLPIAVDDNLTTSLGTALLIDINNDLITPNDTHSDATETLSYVSYSTTDLGCVTDPDSAVTENAGIITYTPDPTFTDPSTDCFTYTITDSVGVEQSTAQVNMTITGSLPPVANADAVDVTEDTDLVLDPVHATLSVPGVVPDSDPVPAEIPGLLISAFDVLSANGGAISQAVGTNVLTYTPAANFSGTDTFNYTIQNSVPLIASTTVTVTVAPVNDAPVCIDVGLVTAVDTPLSIDIANDLLSTTSVPPLCTDAEGNAETLSSIDANGNKGGIMAGNGAGTLTYIPATGFIGDETFSYTATDGTDLAAPNVLTVNVANPLASNFTMLQKAGNVFGGTNDVVIEWDEQSFNANPTAGSEIPPFDPNNELITFSSTQPFFAFLWDAHHIRIFKNETNAPITYKFDVTCLASDYDSGIVDCNRPLAEQEATERYLTMTLQPGEIGGHILFDWNTSSNIDVVNIWKENAPWDTLGDTAPKNALWLGEAGIPPAADTDWRLVSREFDGDGINGSAMVDGPFKQFSANFNYKPLSAGEKLPPYEKEIAETKASFSMGIWSVLAGLFSVFGLRRINNKK